MRGREQPDDGRPVYARVHRTRRCRRNALDEMSIASSGSMPRVRFERSLVLSLPNAAAAGHCNFFFSRDHCDP